MIDTVASAGIFHSLTLKLLRVMRHVLHKPNLGKQVKAEELNGVKKVREALDTEDKQYFQL